MMATGLLGHLEQFDPALEEWPQYVERLEQFFCCERYHWRW